MRRQMDVWGEVVFLVLCLGAQVSQGLRCYDCTNSNSACPESRYKTTAPWSRNPEAVASAR